MVIALVNKLGINTKMVMVLVNKMGIYTKMVKVLVLKREILKFRMIQKWLKIVKIQRTI